MTCKSTSTHIAVWTLFALAVCSLAPTANAEPMRGSCSGKLIKLNGEYVIELPPEGICTFTKLGQIGVSAICSEGNHCTVTGVTDDCKDSGECTEFKQIKSVQAGAVSEEENEDSTKPFSCGDITDNGWKSMPDVADHVLAKPGADKLGFGSPCHINSLVFSQCWLEPRWSVEKAIDVLIRKAVSGKRLPETPVCGA